MSDFSFKYFGKNFLVKFNTEDSTPSIIISNDGVSILCSVVFKKVDFSSSNFVNLRTYFYEKYYALGKIPKTKNRREHFQSTNEILISRLIDRSVRTGIKDNIPLEICINIMTLHIKNSEDIIVTSVLGASILLKKYLGHMYNFIIPVQVFIDINNKIYINSSHNVEKKNITACIILAMSKTGINMMEIFSYFNAERKINFINKINSIFEQSVFFTDKIENLIKIIEVHKINYDQFNSSIFFNKENIKKYIFSKLKKLFIYKNKSKFYDSNTTKIKIYELKNKIINDFKFNEIENIFNQVVSNFMIYFIKTFNLRLDNRKINDIREINVECMDLENMQDNILISRGYTKSFITLTLGNIFEDILVEDSLCSMKNKNIYAHYNFPEWSVGEINRNKSVSRREIGHGKILERSLLYISNKKISENIVYRVVSDIISSDGSSSMLSVIGGSLILNRNLGSKVISGISLGLLKLSENNYIEIIDLSAIEDAFGCIDLKIVSDDFGNIITLQMDSKNEFLSPQIITNLILKGIETNFYIIDKINCISTSLSLPDKDKLVCKELKVNQKLVKYVIGFQGQNIKSINDQCDVKIFIRDDIVFIIGRKENVKKAELIILEILENIQLF